MFEKVDLLSKRAILSTVILLVFISAAIGVSSIFINQNCIKLKEGFPSFSSFFDREKWSTLRAKKYVKSGYGAMYQIEEIELLIMQEREDMIFDLLAHHCDIITRRESALRALGQPVNLPCKFSESFRIYWSNIENLNVKSDKNDYNQHRDSIITHSPYEFSKFDLIYIAGANASGNCLLALLYDKNGDIIKCGWFEAQ